VEEPAVIAALEGEEGHHEGVGDGTVGEVIYRRNESENGKDLRYRPRRSRQRLEGNGHPKEGSRSRDSKLRVMLFCNLLQTLSRQVSIHQLKLSSSFDLLFDGLGSKV
jgi:hypothetical protein